MVLTFYKQAATPNRVDKSSYLSTTGTVPGVVLKSDTDLMHPVFILKTSVVVYNSNYLYCSFTGRYYYIEQIDALSGGRIAVHCKIDVLHTYRNEIKSSSGWVIKSAVSGSTPDDFAMLHNDFPFRADFDILGCDLADSHTPFTNQTNTHPIIMVIK